MTDQPLKILSVMLGGQLFGIDIGHISDILPRQDDTPVPQAGRRISGLINLRGHIVTLIHVRLCLGLSSQDTSKMNVVIEYGGELYGLLFDEVGDILDLDRVDMESVPSVLDERWHGLGQGVFRLPQGLLILLDAVKLVESARPENIFL